MRFVVASLLLLLALPSVNVMADPSGRENPFPGEWVVIPAASPASFVFEFKDYNRVINKTTNTAGTYELLKNNRILMQFTGELILMEYYESDGSLFLNGLVASQPQQVALTFVEPTEMNLQEVKESYETRFKAQQEAILRMQRQAIAAAVRNNLRQFASAAQMYMLENGVSEVSYRQLVEANLIDRFDPINGESYDDLLLDLNVNEISVMDSHGTAHSFSF
jgi:hypothetical protein